MGGVIDNLYQCADNDRRELMGVGPPRRKRKAKKRKAKKWKVIWQKKWIKKSIFFAQKFSPRLKGKNRKTKKRKVFFFGSENEKIWIKKDGRTGMRKHVQKTMKTHAKRMWKFFKNVFRSKVWRASNTVNNGTKPMFHAGTMVQEVVKLRLGNHSRKHWKITQ